MPVPRRLLVARARDVRRVRLDRRADAELSDTTPAGEHEHAARAVDDHRTDDDGGCGLAATPAVAPTAAAAIPEAAPPLNSAARVTTTAARDIEFDIDATCDIATAQALAARHPGVRQFVLVKTTSFTVSSGTVEVVGRSVDGTWRCQRAAQFARLGRNGTRVLADRRSGDGTTPAGVFPLGSVTAWDGQTFQFFGNSPDPGVRGTYRNVRHEDCWGATPNTARYQHVVNLPQCPGTG